MEIESCDRYVDIFTLLQSEQPQSNDPDVNFNRTGNKTMQ